MAKSEGPARKKASKASAKAKSSGKANAARRRATKSARPSGSSAKGPKRATAASAPALRRSPRRKTAAEGPPAKPEPAPVREPLSPAAPTAPAPARAASSGSEATRDVSSPVSVAEAPERVSTSGAVPPAPPLDGPPRPRETIAPKIEIPPLPDDDFEGFVPIDQFSDVRGAEPEDSRPEPPDEFEPIEEERVEAARTAPPGRSAKEVLAGVWAGEFHASALDGFPDAEIERLAVEYRLVPEPGERRADLLYRLVHEGAARSPVETFAAEGLLEVMPEGYGFLRQAEHSYAAHEADPYVPGGLIRRVGLRMGHWVGGTARRPRPGERYAALVEVEEVNHEDPESLAGTVPFEELTVTHPDRRFVLETTPGEVAMRVLDLFCPLGRGQRALVVSPPRAGKTILLQKLADSIAHNAPEAEIVVLLVDERPEEVTNMRRSVRGEVIASTFDYAARRHIQVAELVMEKVKRMVEMGRHVVLLLDSLTRLGRAYNNESGGRGRLLTGGLEANALTKPKRFFGAARNVEGGGSLTIVATALVDTGSRLDQVIFEEFKGTGNMEVALSRELANRRIWPAIDIPKSGTRKEELLLHPDEQRRVTAMRREMSGMDPADAMLDVLERMEKHETNAELLMSVST